MIRMTPAPKHLAPIARWLALCLTLVALMVAVGGITRLTESGLSIVEWKLFSGTLPPMSSSAWQAEFEAYQHTPQFKQVNANFTLRDFQHIFWLEYIHRLLGRIIGLVVILPLIYFTVRRALPVALLVRMLLIGLLVGAQGTVGWIMVASGLHDEPRVEPLKLALHLILAFAVFCLLLWTRWQVLAVARPITSNRGVALAARALLLLATIQIIFGALVAGLRAGYYYNSYPLMDGQLVPSGLAPLEPWWRNHLENIMTVQFQHRMGALAVTIAVVGFALYSWRSISDRRWVVALLAIITIQFALGVATLLTTVNLWLASAHQLVALALVATLVRTAYAAPLDSSQRLLKKRR